LPSQKKTTLEVIRGKARKAKEVDQARHKSGELGGKGLIRQVGKTNARDVYFGEKKKEVNSCLGSGDGNQDPRKEKAKTGST